MMQIVLCISHLHPRLPPKSRELEVQLGPRLLQDDAGHPQLRTTHFYARLYPYRQHLSGMHLTALLTITNSTGQKPGRQILHTPSSPHCHTLQNRANLGGWT